MSRDMPDFAMPSEEDLAAERRAAAIARARATNPTSALRDRPGVEQVPVDEAALHDAERPEQHEQHDGEDEPTAHASPLPPPDPGTRILPRRADGGSGKASPTRRLRAVARNPVVAFAAGAALVAAGFLAAPALIQWTERGSAAELQRLLDDYVDAVNEGDVDAVLALHRPDGGTASTALLDAGVSPSSLPSVACADPMAGSDSDVAVVSCSLSVAGFGTSGAPTQLRLERVDGGWRIESGLVQRTGLAPVLFELVSVEGVPMSGVLDAEDEWYWLLPGGYETETRTSDLVELTDYGGLVVGEGGGFLNIYPQASDEVSAAAEDAALAFAQGCVADEATAASCGIAPPPDGRVLTASVSQQGYPLDATTLGVPVRIAGTGSPASPIVEVLVRFDDAWTTYDLEVTGVTEDYG